MDRDRKRIKSFVPVVVFAAILSAVTLILLYCSDVKIKREEEFWIFSRIGGRLVHNGTTVETPPKKNHAHQDEYDTPNASSSTGLASIYNKFAAILEILESPWSKNETKIAASPVKVPDRISFSMTHTLSIENAPNKTEEKDDEGKRPTERDALVFTNGPTLDRKPSRVVFVDDKTTSTTVRPNSIFSFLFSNPQNKISIPSPENKNGPSRLAENSKHPLNPLSSKIESSMVFPQNQDIERKPKPKPKPRPIASPESVESSEEFPGFEPFFDYPALFDDMFAPEIDPFAYSDYGDSQMERRDHDESTQSDDDSSATDLWHYFLRPMRFRSV